MQGTAGQGQDLRHQGSTPLTRGCIRESQRPRNKYLARHECPSAKPAVMLNRTAQAGLPIRAGARPHEAHGR